MVVTALVFAILVVVSFICDLVIINTGLFHESTNSNIGMKIVSVFCAEGLGVAKRDIKHPILTYFKRRFIGILSLVLCIAFIVWRIR